jgi:hypothetical protein
VTDHYRSMSIGLILPVFRGIKRGKHSRSAMDEKILV